jgi:hypothetical protein
MGFKKQIIWFSYQYCIPPGFKKLVSFSTNISSLPDSNDDHCLRTSYFILTFVLRTSYFVINFTFLNPAHQNKI